MKKKKEKKQEETGVNKIISENFFKQLSKKGVSQSQYAKEHFLNPATISNWKSGNGVMSAEQIMEAANYFDITVNDLFYDDETKKKMEVLSNKNYHPIMAQQTIETRLLNYNFNNPFKSLATIFSTFIVLIFFSFILVKQSPYWSLIILTAFFSVYWFYTFEFGENKTFIINYLDDIYYHNDNKKLSRKKNIVLQSIILMLHIILMIGLILSYSVANIEKELILIIILLLIISFVLVLLSSFIMFSKYRNKMYDTEFEHHKYSILTMCCSITLLGFTTSLVSFGMAKHWVTFVISLIMVVLSILNYYFVCINYRNYSLVYENDRGEIERLFEKNI